MPETPETLGTMPQWIAVLQTIVVPILVGFLVWLIQHRSETRAAVKLEQVRTENAAALEELKAELEGVRTDFRRWEARVTDYDRKQADHLAEIYAGFWSLKRDGADALDKMLSERGTAEQRRSQLAKLEAAALEMLMKVHRVGVYLPADLEHSLIELGGKIRLQLHNLGRRTREGTWNGTRDPEMLLATNEIEATVKKVKEVVRGILSGARTDEQSANGN